MRFARGTKAVLLASSMASTLITGSCTSPRPMTPDPWASTLALRPFTDRNADPHIVEVDLDARYADWEISPGRLVRAMTYNGGVPGPLLEANVGDHVIVHFTNHLDEPTTIHWHGVRVPNSMDGSPDVQSPIAPGASFDYEFDVPDAGTFWYHPHVAESVQMEHGLYGPIVVRGPNEPAVDREGVIVLDDLLLDATGQIAPPGDLLEQHSGREGTLSIVNGRLDATLPIRAGQRQRWRIVNAGSARFYRLGLAGHRFTILGTDGGFLAQSQDVEELFLVPGDRVDVVVTATGQPGTTVPLQNLPYPRGHGAGVFTAENVLTVQYTSDSALPVPDLRTSYPSIARIDTTGATPRQIQFDEMIDATTETVTFTINGASYPNVPTFDAHIGQPQVWDLVNMSEMDHPFHLHGFFFQVLERNGVAETTTSLEDTVDLHGSERVRIAFVPDARAGMWMYHCHILEHADHGMMADFMVMP